MRALFAYRCSIKLDTQYCAEGDVGLFPFWLQPFFRAMHRALKPGGVVCTQV